MRLNRTYFQMKLPWATWSSWWEVIHSVSSRLPPSLSSSNNTNDTRYVRSHKRRLEEIHSHHSPSSWRVHKNQIRRTDRDGDRADEVEEDGDDQEGILRDFQSPSLSSPDLASISFQRISLCLVLKNISAIGDEIRCIACSHWSPSWLPVKIPLIWNLGCLSPTPFPRTMLLVLRFLHNRIPRLLSPIHRLLDTFIHPLITFSQISGILH